MNANIDQTICANATLSLVGQASGLFPGGTAVVTWSQVSGPSAVITSPHSLTTTVTSIIGGNTYKFSLSCPCADGSIAYDEQTVTVKTTPVANAGPDQTAKCNGSPAGNLAGNALLSGETGTWSLSGSPSGVTIVSPSSPTSAFNFTGGSSENVTFIWTKTISGSICNSYDEVVIPKAGYETPVTASATTPTACYNTTTTSTLTGSFSGTGIGGQGGLWTVVSGPNMPTITSPTANNTTVTNLIPGAYTFKWTMSGPCTTGFATTSITVPSPVGAPTTASASIQGAPAMPVCNGTTSFVLVGNSTLLPGETGTWSQTTSRTATIVSPGSPTTEITGLDGVGPYNFRYSIVNGSTGCLTTKDVAISYGTAPSITLITTSPYLLPCSDTTATISYSKTGSGTLQYSILSGPPVPHFYPTIPTAWASAGGPPAVLTHFTVPGTYVIRFRIEEGTGSLCTAAFQDITIIVSKVPTGSNSGSSQNLACNVVETHLVGNIPATGTGQWTQVSGPNTAVFANTALFNTLITGLISGAYTFRWLISAGPACSTQQSDVIVRVANAQPTTANAGPDQVNVCFGTPIYLAGNTPVLNETGTWRVTPGSGITFSNAHSPTAVVNGLVASTSYTFTWTITNACDSSADHATISTTSAQGPVASNAGPDQCKSSGTTSITLAGNAPSPSGGSGLWTEYSGGSATITSPTSPTSTVTGMADGTYKFIWTVTFGSCAVSRDTMMVTISAPATASSAGPDQSVCATSVTLAGNNPAVGIGNWIQVSGSGGATITDTTLNNTTVTGLMDGVYTFRWTISNHACPSSTADDVQINASTPPTTAAAGPDQSRCGVTTATMAANTVTNGTGYWSMISGPGQTTPPTITTPASPVTTVTGLTTGTYTFRWNIYGGPFCPISTDDVNIIVVPAADAGADQGLCNVTATTLTGNETTSGTWSWVSGPNTPSISPASGSSVAQVTGMIPGVYVFKYTIPATAGCSETNDNMTVTISGLPTTAAAGPDQNLCNATGWTAAANTPGTGTGSWTQIAGTNTPVFSPSTSPTATVTGATAQSYVYEWKITNGYCISADQVTINISDIATSANAGPDQTHVCGTEATLAATPPANSSFGVGTWTQISGPNTASISSLITYNTTITGLIPGTYVFRWTITSGSCSAIYDEVSITDFANPTTANAGADQSLCNVTSTTLAANSISSGTGLWSKISGPSGSSFGDATSPTSSLNGMVPGTYVLQWTSTLGTCTLSDEVTIVNYAAPSTSAAASALSNCLFSALNLAGNTPGTGTGTWTQTAGSTVIIVAPTSPTTQILGAVAGSYTFRWTISNGTCTPSTSDEVVTVTASPTMALAGPDQSKTCYTTTATLAGNAPSVGTGTWTQTSGPNTATIANANQYNSGLSGLINGTYGFQWQIANGTCTSTDNMQVVINYKTADLSIAKTDGASTYTPGANNIYTIVASNAGPDNSIGAIVTDNAPAGTTITSWTAVFTSGATGTASGTGNISQTINLPSGTTATYTVNLAVPCTYTGSLANTAIVAKACDLDVNNANNSATDSDTDPYTTSVWNGTTNDWNLGSNWSNGIPSATKGASIPSGTPFNPVIDGTGMAAAKLIIQNGANLTINPGKDLTVAGCTQINGACGLSLKSDATSGNASFVTSQGGEITYPNNGTACVEVYITSCPLVVPPAGCWHYVSSPLTDVRLGDVFKDDYIQKYDEVLGAWSGFISNGNLHLAPEEGILISNPVGSVRTFRGRLNDGTVSMTLSRTAGKGGGWNLVGNPYPSEIDLNTSMDWTNVDKVIYFYSKYAGTYKPYNALTQIGTGTRYIPSMQGFFVHVNSLFTSGSLQFTDANRTVTGDTTFYKDLKADLIKLKVAAPSGMNDEIIVYFQQDATPGYDQGIDCLLLNGIEVAPQLNAVTTDNKKVTIDALPFAGVNTVVPLEFNVVSNGTGNYSITASKFESFRSGTTITLEDKKAGTSQELTTNPVYTFSYTTGDDPARFLLHFHNPFYAVGEHAQAEEMLIYSHGHVVYLKDLTGKPDDGEMFVYNILGQELAQKPVTAIPLNKYTFDVPEGYYFIRVITKNKTYNTKLYLDK